VHVRGPVIASSSDPTLGMDFGSEQYPTKKLFRRKKKHILEIFCFFWGFDFGGHFLIF
jgi:hypothetical protein